MGRLRHDVAGQLNAAPGPLLEQSLIVAVLQGNLEFRSRRCEDLGQTKNSLLSNTVQGNKLTGMNPSSEPPYLMQGDIQPAAKSLP